MPYAPWARLGLDRITAIFNEIQKISDRRLPRVWQDRIPTVTMEDGDILARIPVEQIVMADILEYDQAAIIRADTPIRLTQSEIPKLKHGRMLSEQKIMLLHRIEMNQASSAEKQSFDTYVAQSLQALLLGIIDRKELLINQMLRDTSSYNRYGMKWDNLSWGMPSDLKFTANPLWTDASNAKPISDILAVKNYALNVWGEAYNRVTMALPDLQLIVATKEFQDQLKLFFPLAGITSVNILTIDLAKMAGFVGQMLGMTLELYEARTKEENADGSLSSLRFHDVGELIFTDSNDDGNAATWRWGNGVLAETVPGIIPDIIGGDFAGEGVGPIAYATAANAQGNPPGFTFWAAQRGFPVKNRETASAVLTVV